MDATPIIVKKRKHQEHGHHGGSWKVAYADFVTAMMAFFMVLWIMGLSDDAKAQIQGYFNDPIGFTKNQPRTRTVLHIPGNPASKPGSSSGSNNQPYQSERASMKELKEELEHTIKQQADMASLLEHIVIQVGDDGLRIEFLEDRQDFFEFGKAKLKPGAIKLIGKLGPKLAATSRAMVIEGHTDSVGSRQRNWELSSERALALMRALGSSGVTRFQAVRGLADTQLRDAAHPTSGVNRRVTILLPYTATPTSTLPMPKEDVRRLIRDAIRPQIEVKPAEPQITPAPGERHQ